MDQKELEMDDCCLRILESDDDFIYVEEEKEGMDSDDWKYYNQSLSCIILNKFYHTLEASPENHSAQFQDLTERESQKDRCKFKLHIYKKTTSESGIAVSFAVQVESKTYHMYCTEDKSIEFREGEPLKSIPGNTSDIIFYQVWARGKPDIFWFRSSLFKGCYLASERNSNKLYLKEAAPDEVDEACRLKVKKCP